MDSKEKTKYRRTHQWKNWRSFLIKKRENRCDICGMKHKTGLQVHHCDEAHYTDLREQKFAVLCKRCHQLVEQLISRKELDIVAFCENLKIIFEKSKSFEKMSKDNNRGN